jgi:uncharacterized protein YjbI with pentapeptide repeats
MILGAIASPRENLVGADLSEAILCEAVLEGVDLDQAIVKGAIKAFVRMP